MMYIQKCNCSVNVISGGEMLEDGIFTLGLIYDKSHSPWKMTSFPLGIPGYIVSSYGSLYSVSSRLSEQTRKQSILTTASY